MKYNLQEQKVTKILRKTGGRPYSVDGHFYFIDFTNFTSSAKNPIYFSSIRDPIERFRSKYFFARKESWASFYHRKLTAMNSGTVRGSNISQWLNKACCQSVNQFIFEKGLKCHSNHSQTLYEISTTWNSAEYFA